MFFDSRNEKGAIAQILYQNTKIVIFILFSSWKPARRTRKWNLYHALRRFVFLFRTISLKRLLHNPMRRRI